MRKLLKLALILILSVLNGFAYSSPICELRSKPIAEITQKFSPFGKLILEFRKCSADSPSIKLKPIGLRPGSFVAKSLITNEVSFRLLKKQRYQLELPSIEQTFFIEKSSGSTWEILDESGAVKYLVIKDYETGDENTILKFKIQNTSSKNSYAILKKDPLTHTPDLLNLMAGLFNWSVHLSKLNAVPYEIIFAMVALETKLAK